jgi:hypothetical protein
MGIKGWIWKSVVAGFSGTIVHDPAFDVRIVRLDQILQGLVAVMVKRPPPDCPADGR